MRFLIVGDVHFKGTNPRARLDNYMEAITNKFYEVFQIAERYGVEAIVQTGDLLDSPSTTWGVVGELACLFQKSPCPILSIHGNHDIWGGNAESKHRTPFGLLARLGIVQDVEDRPFEKVFDDVCVSGCGFTAETDTEAGMGQFSPLNGARADIFKIHVVHSMLMDKAPGFDMRHTLISQVKTTADVIVCGHLHTGFGSSYVVRRDDGVLFVNPGALCRLSAGVEEMERTVQVGLLTVESDAKIGGGEVKADVKLIPLKSALTGDVVLSREHLEAERDRSGRLDKFLSLLASEGESKFLEVRDIVEDLAARENIPLDVKKEALTRIGKAREMLGKTGEVIL